MTIKPLITLTILLIMEACSESKHYNWEEEVKNTDIEFSNFSVEHGANAAFLEFASNDVVLLKPNMHPIVSRQVLETYYQGKSDTAFTLKWSPEYVRVSKSGDLAYTYGFWELTEKENSDSIRKGTYLTIWEKQNDGRWKFVLDTGNSGLGD